MGLPIGHNVRSQLCLSRDVNYLISLTIRCSSTSASNDLGFANTDQTTSGHSSDNPKQRLNHVKSNSLSSEQTICTRGRDSEQIQIPIQGTESEWLVACVELLKVSKEGRGWKLAWFISGLEQQIEHLQGQQHQLTAAIKLQHEQLKPAGTHSLHFYIGPPCTVSKKFSPSPLLMLAELAEYNTVLEASNRDLKNMAAFFEDHLNDTWKMNSRIQQHVGEEISWVRKASTRRFRARMAKVPKAEKASNKSLLKEMDPLIKVGVAIRNRFLEQCRGFPPDHPVIYLGNRAAHDGNPLADALLYRSELPNKRTDISRYLSIYGFSPEKILSLRDCGPLIKIISWNGSVRSWYTPSNFKCSAFSRIWPSDFFKKYAGASIASIQAEFANDQQSELINKLEAEYLLETKRNQRISARKPRPGP
jgi:hypothetical protein